MAPEASTIAMTSAAFSRSSWRRASLATSAARVRSRSRLRTSRRHSADDGEQGAAGAEDVADAAVAEGPQEQQGRADQQRGAQTEDAAGGVVLLGLRTAAHARDVGVPGGEDERGDGQQRQRIEQRRVAQRRPDEEPAAVADDGEDGGGEQGRRADRPAPADRASGTHTISRTAVSTGRADAELHQVGGQDDVGRPLTARTASPAASSRVAVSSQALVSRRRRPRRTTPRAPTTTAT